MSYCLIHYHFLVDINFHAVFYRCITLCNYKNRKLSQQHKISLSIFLTNNTLYFTHDPYNLPDLYHLYLLVPSCWLTCSRVLFILSWHPLMLSTSLINEFSTPSFTISMPLRPSLKVLFIVMQK